MPLCGQYPTCCDGMTETHSCNMFYMSVMPRTERNIIKRREAWMKLFADLIGNGKMNGCKGGHREKKNHPWWAKIYFPLSELWELNPHPLCRFISPAANFFCMHLFPFTLYNIAKLLIKQQIIFQCFCCLTWTVGFIWVRQTKAGPLSYTSCSVRHLWHVWPWIIAIFGLINAIFYAAMVAELDTHFSTICSFTKDLLEPSCLLELPCSCDCTNWQNR